MFEKLKAAWKKPLPLPLSIALFSILALLSYIWFGDMKQTLLGGAIYVVAFFLGRWKRINL